MTIKNSIIEDINEQVGFSEEDTFIPDDEIPVNLTEEFHQSLTLPLPDTRKVTMGDITQKLRDHMKAAPYIAHDLVGVSPMVAPKNIHELRAKYGPSLYDSTAYISTMPNVQPNFGSTPEQPESIKVLHECIEVQTKKSRDYQNPNSRVKQADYYPRGIDSIMDMINTKYLRCISLIESGAAPNHESIEDSLKDMINYASFGVSFLRGKIDGQKK